MTKFIATRSFRYGTRRLLAGDEFEAKPIHGRLLVAVKKAKALRDPGALTAPSPIVTNKLTRANRVKREADPITLVEPAVVAADPLDHDHDGHKGGSPKPDASDDLTAARAEYQAAVGKRPFHGWDAETLREKIAEAAGAEEDDGDGE